LPTLVLTEELRQRLKQPLGELIRGTPEECNRKLKKLAEEEKPTAFILVGDTISRNAVDAGIWPSVIIIDGREMRQEAPPIPHTARRVLQTSNPPGAISQDAWKTVEKAAAEGNCLVLVNGEEDLLTLAAILVAQVGSIVAYGQPHEGIVVVKVTADKKKEIQQIVETMEKMD